MITIILKNNRPVAYANTEEEAKLIAIAAFFKATKSPYVPRTWEDACIGTNIDRVYSFRNLTQEIDEMFG